MNYKKYFFLFVIYSVVIFIGCSAQENKDKGQLYSELHNRKPAVAGQFYPASKNDLSKILENLFSEAETPKNENVLAIISPHAGYIYSGGVAASSFNQVSPDRTYENVFVIASSHTAHYKGASLYSPGNYETPLGEVKVNLDLVNKLINENDFFSYIPQVHVSEHSLEVQLPFLQYHLKNDFKLVPIVIGTQTKYECRKMAEALKSYFNENNLFIISSDFSHFPAYEEANKWDKLSADAILLNDPDEFLKAINDKQDDHVKNLATRACGWSSVLTLLYLTQNLPDIQYSHIQYKNSGDADIGDRSRVVGYHAIVVSKSSAVKSGHFHLNYHDKKDLLDIARNTVNTYIESGIIPDLEENYSDILNTHCGAFVTLNKNHNLRGCIGRFTADQPLYKVVQQMAIASSTQDSRFEPVEKSELKEIEIEISVLAPMTKINSIDEIQLGKHGIYISKGYQSGTFLPQVATETGWNLEEFLGHCARDKAGLGWDGWKDADIYIYEATVFSEHDFK
jgi:AmmeMemoRadiSam system protein B/AmmeMemoRadiSam system protein A